MVSLKAYKEREKRHNEIVSEIKDDHTREAAAQCFAQLRFCQDSVTECFTDLFAEKPLLKKVYDHYELKKMEK